MAVSALLVGAALLASACDRRGPNPSAKEQRPLRLPDPLAGVTPPAADLLAWIHRDSELVLRVNLVQLRASPIWHQELEPWLTAQLAATLPAMRSRCGIELLTSVETVAVGLRRFVTTIEGSVVLRGPEPRELWDCLRACRDALRADGIDPRWDDDILSLRTSRGNGVVLVGEDDGLIRGQLGVEASTEELQKTAKKPPMLKASPGFLELVDRLDGNASGWFLLQGPLLEFAAEEHVPLRAVTGTVSATAGDRSDVGAPSGAGDATRPAGITFDVRLRTSTAERAVRFADTARTRLSAAGRAAFTRLDIAAEGDDVHVTAELTMPQLRELMALGGAALAELLSAGPRSIPPAAPPLPPPPAP
jgi:hypothetical protein